MSRGKKLYFGVLILTLILVSTVYFSYAFFTNKVEGRGKLNIIAGTLDYKLENENLNNNMITVEKGETKEFMITVTSLNEIDSKYELYYLLEENNKNIEIGYSADTKDQPTGTINAKGTKEITVIIENNSSSSITVEFKVAGGFVRNELVLTEGNRLEEIKDSLRGFAKIIYDNNPLIEAEPTLTVVGAINTTNDASGFYKSTDTNSGKPTYYFRGEVTNNYVSYAGQTWRIVRINEDGTIRLILQTIISNNTASFNPSTNNKNNMYYTNSNVANGAKTVVDNWYQTNIENKGYSNKIKTGNYFCEQARVAFNEECITGSTADMKLYTEYIPTFKCETDANGYGIVNSNVGLITYDEAVYAGGRTMHPYASTFYLLDGLNGNSFYTMSPAGYGRAENAASPARSWAIYSGGYFYYSSVSNTHKLRPVINLDPDVKVVGTGYSNNPYLINDTIKKIGSTSYNEELWKYKSEITKIVIQNELKPMEGLQSWNISASGKENIIAYYDSSTKTAYIQGDGKIYANPDSSYLFYNFTNLTEIEGLEYIDTSYVTNMQGMFQGCSSLESLNVSSWNTSSVTNMRDSFLGCSNLTTLNLNSWDFSKVTDTYRMLQSCSKLNTTINITSTSIKTYTYMFYFAATEEGAQITVNYTSAASTLVDNMIKTKYTTSSVKKGDLIS